MGCEGRPVDFLAWDPPRLPPEERGEVPLRVEAARQSAGSCRRRSVRSEFRLMCACHNLLKLWRAVLAGVARKWKRGTGPLPWPG